MPPVQPQIDLIVVPIDTKYVQPVDIHIAVELTKSNIIGLVRLNYLQMPLILIDKPGSWITVCSISYVCDTALALGNNR